MLASRPPLGWNSWNTFGEKISDALIREMADYMADKGWKDAGYPCGTGMRTACLCRIRKSSPTA